MGNEIAAREVRDISIECMALLDRTVLLVKECCAEAFFLEYRRACGHLMGEFVDVINRAARDFPKLEPTEEEWLAGSRAGEVWLKVKTPVQPDEVRSMLSRVRARVGDIQSCGPEMSGPLGHLDSALARLERVLQGWMPQIT
jgi:hypothetical protein